jgi:hypothetical protein
LNKHETYKVVSNHAYILFYQKRGIDFDNIKEYGDIKNILKGVSERFDPNTVRFPLLPEIP